MGTFTTVAVWVCGAVFFVYVIVCEFLDTIGRLEVVEDHWPKVYRAMSNRPMRLVLIVFLLALVAKDLTEHSQDALGLVVNMPAPPSPTITFITPTPPPRPSGQPALSSAWDMSAGKEQAFMAGAATSPSMFRVVVAMDDPESFRFGTEISALLKRVGWRESTEIARTPWEGRFQGVTVHVSNRNFQSAADLQSDFRANGLDAEGKLDASIPEGIVQIDVGYKPDYWKP